MVKTWWEGMIVWEKLSKLRDSTLATLDTKRLELRVSTYSKELQQMYSALGEIYYNAKRNKGKINEAQVEGLLEGVDRLQQRIKYLGKHILEKKQKNDTGYNEPKSSEPKEHKAYAKLRRNQEDLMIKRTVDGIQFLKLCPECLAQIQAEQLVCEHCYYHFSDKKGDSI